MEAKVNNFQNNAKDSNIILTSESNEMDLSVKLSKIFSYNGHNVSFIKTSYGILLLPHRWQKHSIRNLPSI